MALISATNNHYSISFRLHALLLLHIYIYNIIHYIFTYCELHFLILCNIASLTDVHTPESRSTHHFGYSMFAFDESW